MIEHGLVYLTLACVFGFFMAWGVGANDVANAMGTSVGSRALTMRQAIVIAIIFEAAGAILASAQVTNTIGSGMLHFSAFASQPYQLLNGMLASLLAAGTWLLIATRYGWPVSTTHSIVGAVIGFSTVCLGVDSVKWHVVNNIALSWVVTPIIAAALAFSLFTCVQRFVFDADHPVQRARLWIPAYIFLVVNVIMMVTLLQGLKHRLALSYTSASMIACGISAVCGIIGYWLLRAIKNQAHISYREQFVKVEKMFAILMVFTAAAMAFAHGSNDVANAIGPLAAIVSLVKSNGHIHAGIQMPSWVVMVGAGGIVLGLMTYGFKVIATIGQNITQLTPSRGFAAQLATASTVVLSSGFGLPVSTTQVMVGSVLGVGMARGMSALNVRVIRNIFMSWVITLPIGALLAIVYYFLLEHILSIALAY